MLGEEGAPVHKLNGMMDETNDGWIDAPVHDDMILMNVGNCLEYLSGFVLQSSF